MKIRLSIYHLHVSVLFLHFVWTFIMVLDVQSLVELIKQSLPIPYQLIGIILTVLSEISRRITSVNLGCLSWVSRCERITFFKVNKIRNYNIVSSIEGRVVRDKMILCGREYVCGHLYTHESTYISVSLE